MARIRANDIISQGAILLHARPLNDGSIVEEATRKSFTNLNVVLRVHKVQYQYSATEPRELADLG